MYCSNQSSMATLLQQKSFMKNLTNGTNNVVVVNGTNETQTTTMAAGTTMASVPGSASRMLLPHETTTLIHQQPLIHQQTFTSTHSPASSSISSLTNSSSFNSQFISHLQSNHHLSSQQIFTSNSSHQHIVTTTATPTTSFSSHFNNNAYVDVNAIFRPAASPTTTSTASMQQQSFSSTHHPLPHLTNNNTTRTLVYINGTEHSPVTVLSKSSSHLHSHHHHHQQTVFESQTANTTDSGECGNGTDEQPATATDATDGGSLDTKSGIVLAADASEKAQEDDQEQEPEPEIDIVINNVVCSFSVRCHLNLRDIALKGFNVEFRRENGMVTMKLRRPYTTASIWSSGKITCTGATSEDQAKIAARRYSRCLQKLGFNARFRNFRIVNVLGTCSMPWGIMIVNFSEKYKKDASYEPELHPGVTYKLYNPKATLKIFSTGSITVTAASVAYVQAAIEHIFPLVYEFRKKRTPQEKIEMLKPPVFDPEQLIEEDCDIESATVLHDGDDDDADAFDDDEDVRTGNNDTKAINHLRRNRRRLCKSRYSSSRNGGRRRPAGKADNDPTEDAMFVSDDDDDVVEEIESDDE